MMPGMTRRGFAALTTMLAATQATGLYAQGSKAAAPTAADIIARLSARSGVALTAKSADGFKAGEPATPVRGVAVTAMATIDVLRQAAKAGLNLVITLEPTFFGRGEAQASAAPPWPGAKGIAQDDPVLVAKRRLIEQEGLVIYRLYDQWVGRAQNEHARALAGAMGWSRSLPGGEAGADVEIAPTRLVDLVPQLRGRLKAGGGTRVIGHPDTVIRRVSVLPGIRTLEDLLHKLPHTDLILAGETRDWEGVEYVDDAATAGLGKAMVTLGRVVSEEPGMRACAAWLKQIASEVPVTSLVTGEPFWRPA